MIKGRLSIDHLIEDAAERPDIAGPSQLHQAPSLSPALVDVRERFRRHVVDCAHLNAALNVCGILRHCLCYAEIDQLEPPFHNDKVGRLQVRVDNVVLMNGPHGMQHLAVLVNMLDYEAICIYYIPGSNSSV